jgi:predicted transcriptional regulator
MLSKYEVEAGASESLETIQPRRMAGSRSSAKNRGWLDTVEEIVNGCTGGVNKSRVMLVANINSVVATEMLEKLVASGLVYSRRDGNSIVYNATREGLDFVNKYSELVSMLCPGMIPQTRVIEVSKGAQAWI